jgi:amino acid transporter
VGEAQNPRKTIPRAIKLTFYRIIFFYVLSVFLLGLIVPYDHPDLIFASKKSNSAAASPFVVAIQIAGIKGLPGFLNACILIFVFSAANSDLYIATRTIYGIALQGKAPRILARTDRRGVPYVALALSACFCLLAYMNVSSDSKIVFGYFYNLVTIFGLLTWVSILVTHIYFIRARKAQGIPVSALAYTAPLGIWGSYFALFWCVIIALTKNFNVFTKGDYGAFDYKNFVTGYLGIPLYLIMIFGYKVYQKYINKDPILARGVKPIEADFYTGKDVIDREEEEFLANKAALGKSNKGGKFYKRYIGWLL